MTLVLIVSTIAVVNAAAQTQDRMCELRQIQADMAEMEAQTDAILGEGISENQRKALEWLELMQEGFEHTRSGDVVFPSFYGGVYLGYDGRPVVLIVESEIQEARGQNHLSEIIADGNYRFVEYSYAELRETQRVVWDKIIERALICNYADNAIMIRVCTMSNRVIVSLIDNNDEMIMGFRLHVYDSLMLDFERRNPISMPGTGDSPFCAVYYNYTDNNHSYSIYEEKYTGITPASVWPVNPGHGLFRVRLSGWLPPDATMGFRAFSNSYGGGFVSVAHSFDHGQMPVHTGYFNGVVGRTTSKRVYNPAIGMDAVFIRHYWGHQGEITNTLPNGLTLSTNVVGSFIQNMTVISAGARTGGVTWSTIIAPNGSFRIAGTNVSFENVVITNGSSRPGDSGGTVFLPSLTTAGIIVGGTTGADSLMAFVPAHRILSTLNLFRY